MYASVKMLEFGVKLSLVLVHTRPNSSVKNARPPFMGVFHMKVGCRRSFLGFGEVSGACGRIWEFGVEVWPKVTDNFSLVVLN